MLSASSRTFFLKASNSACASRNFLPTVFPLGVGGAGDLRPPCGSSANARGGRGLIVLSGPLVGVVSLVIERLLSDQPDLIRLLVVPLGVFGVPLLLVQLAV